MVEEKGLLPVSRGGDTLGYRIRHPRLHTAEVGINYYCSVWVKGHSRDPGNTVADKAADTGCEDEDGEVVFPRNTAHALLQLRGGSQAQP
eukprot:1095577-Rhodomonas_salina.1